jgi:hypothetical protein
MRKSYTLLFFLSIICASCKLPELPVALKAKQCDSIMASLSINRDYTKLNEYYFYLDSLKGDVKQITWKINGEIIQELPRNRSFNYTFFTDGNYMINAQVLDSCNKPFELSKMLTVKTDIYVQPITRFMSNDNKEADIQGMTFDPEGVFRCYMIWDNIPNFYPDKSYKFKDCSTVGDGENGDIGQVVAFRYRPSTKQYYVFESRLNECTVEKFGWGDYLFRSTPTLKTHLKLGGRTSFELGKNNIFLRGASNIVLVPYNDIEQIPEITLVKDSIKYNFNNYTYKFGKYNENEYLAISVKSSEYTFVKFYEDSRQAQELFKFKMLENGSDGIYSDNKVGIGSIMDLCIDARGEIWMIENIKRGYTNEQIIYESERPNPNYPNYPYGYRIRKIAKSGVITTIVDNSTPQIAGLVYTLNVNLKKPKCISYNPKDNAVYFSDGGGYKKIVVK